MLSVVQLSVSIILVSMLNIKGGVNFGYLSRRGEAEKFKKGGGSMVQGQVFLKEGGDIFPI